jgi:DNA-binding SARP family transcriptional activator
MFRLKLFGIPQIEYDEGILDIRRRKSLAILAYIGVANRTVSRDFLADLLWPDAEPELARSSLRTALYTLTSSHTVKWLQVDKFQISLDSTLVETDCTLFSQYISQSRQHRHENGDLCETCCKWLTNAEALYQGGFLADFSQPDSATFENWQTVQATIFQREYASILQRLVHYYHKQVADFSQAIRYALRWVDLDPLHEPAHRLVMRLYYQSGQRPDALRQYQTCVSLLDTELATPPEDETVMLYEQIRDGKSVEREFSEVVNVKYSFLPPLPPLVVGRETAIHEIKTLLGITGNRRANIVIQGLPGVGKSTIAAKLAHDADLHNVFPDGILWTSLGEDPDIPSKLQSWAKALGIHQPNPEAAKDLSARIASVLRDKRMLFIVDDIWQAEHSQYFRVGSNASSVVFTSRLKDVALALSSSKLDLYNLSVLSDDSALQLLERLSPDTVREHPEESRELVIDLEGLPLAIQVAGRLLQSEQHLGWGVAELLKELRDGARLLAEPSPGDMMQEDTTPTIAALLKRSTDILSENTRERFTLLGLFVPKPATFDLGAMQAIWDVEDPKPTTRELVNRGLLEPVGGGRFQMHALLVLHARSMMGM